MYLGNKFFIGSSGIIINEEDGFQSSLGLRHIILASEHIEKLPWRPKYKEKYWCFNLIDERVFKDLWDGYKMEKRELELGLISKTEEEAQKKLEYYTKLIKDNPYQEEQK